LLKGGKVVQDICNRLFSLAGPYLTVRHNQTHTEICYEFALRLLRHLGGRPEIVLPAIILHDVGWSAMPTEQHLLAFGPKVIDEELRRVHEIEGAKIAAEILEKVSLDENDRLEICRIIESHDSGANPVSLEEKIVKDADKLFRFSPEGFKIDVERFSVDAREYWKKLHEFRDKWFFTDLGRELASGELQKIEKELYN
jgi:HD superfamily phosphodiesterase